MRNTVAKSVLSSSIGVSLSSSESVAGFGFCVLLGDVSGVVPVLVVEDVPARFLLLQFFVFIFRFWQLDFASSSRSDRLNHSFVNFPPSPRFISFVFWFTLSAISFARNETTYPIPLGIWFPSLSWAPRSWVPIPFEFFLVSLLFRWAELVPAPFCCRLKQFWLLYRSSVVVFFELF